MLLNDSKNNHYHFDKKDQEYDLKVIEEYQQSLRKEFVKEYTKLEVTDKNKDEEEEETVLGVLFSYLKVVIFAVLLSLFLNFVIFLNATVPTGSMKDTIQVNDRIYSFRLAYLFSEPERGDIIVFTSPDNPKELLIKRIIGLPGDVIEIKPDENGVVNVIVNGEVLEEDYIKEPMADQSKSYLVPADSYFVMGDNRNSSNDSRYWSTTNFVDRKRIKAKAMFRYWPNFTWLK